MCRSVKTIVRSLKKYNSKTEKRKFQLIETQKCLIKMPSMMSIRQIIYCDVYSQIAQMMKIWRLFRITKMRKTYLFCPKTFLLINMPNKRKPLLFCHCRYSNWWWMWSKVTFSLCQLYSATIFKTETNELFYVA